MKRLANFYALFLNLMGACFALPLVTALIYDEGSSVRAFALVMIACFVTGGIVHFAKREDLSDMEMKPRETYFIVASTWIIASAIGCVPYILTGSIPGFLTPSLRHARALRPPEPR